MKKLVLMLTVAVMFGSAVMSCEPTSNLDEVIKSNEMPQTGMTEPDVEDNHERPGV